MTEESKKKLINGVREELGTEFEVIFSPIDQYSGTEQKSMTVIPRGHKTGPIFCIEINFRAIPVKETGIKGIARKIADVCRSCYESNQGPEFFAKFDKNEILAKVEYQVINAEKTEHVLWKCPMKGCWILPRSTGWSCQRKGDIRFILQSLTIFVRCMKSAERNLSQRQNRT
ncbi:MAG: hypothetical protein HFG55_00070 [Lachnospiraceae bacterium]|nr:hypothetical protein [Lachnospiraceae bacterium]